ncbi:MAG: hypothetical protein IRY99_03095 [Isosphaeraceae bacterium]|nr:hypothetical protein [Isosphaeraceae bacterium]
MVYRAKPISPALDCSRLGVARQQVELAVPFAHNYQDIGPHRATGLASGITWDHGPWGPAPTGAPGATGTINFGRRSDLSAQDFTIAFAAKFRSYPLQYGEIVAKGSFDTRGWTIAASYQFPGQLALQSFRSGHNPTLLSTSPALLLGQWTTYILTRSGTSLTWYVGGAPISTTTPWDQWDGSELTSAASDDLIVSVGDWSLDALLILDGHRMSPSEIAAYHRDPFAHVRPLERLGHRILIEMTSVPRRGSSPPPSMLPRPRAWLPKRNRRRARG